MSEFNKFSSGSQGQPNAEIETILGSVVDLLAGRPELADALVVVAQWLRQSAQGASTQGASTHGHSTQAHSGPSMDRTAARGRTTRTNGLNLRQRQPLASEHGSGSGDSDSAGYHEPMSRLRENFEAADREGHADDGSGLPNPAHFGGRDPFEDLEHLVPHRARLKADALHWVAARQAEGLDPTMPLEEGPALQKKMSLISEAKSLPNCFLWMLRSPVVGIDDAMRLAGNFECLAVSAELLNLVLENETELPGQSPLPTVVALSAECLSATRESIRQHNNRPDPDVEALFACVRTLTYERRIYVERHMRLDDAAEPGEWEERLDRLHQQQQLLGQNVSLKATQVNLFERLRAHREQLVASLAQPDARPEPQDWNRLVETAVQLVEDGCPPSNRQLLDELELLADALPDRPFPKTFQLILREMDHSMAAREAGLMEAAPESEPEVVLTPEVEKVAELLAGRKVVLIGGECRPEAKRRIEEAFQLSALNWVEAKSHESVDNFEPHIADPDVALVLLAIRWSSHSFGDVKRFCDHYSKPLVRLPAGYGTNQLAQQILEQVGLKLENKSQIPA